MALIFFEKGSPMAEDDVKRAATIALLRLALGAAVAAIVMYVVGVVYWRELLPNTAVRKIYDENDFIRLLETSFPQSGTYMIPGPNEHIEGIRELHETGPLATLHVLKGRSIPSEQELRFVQWLQLFLTAGIIGWVCRKFPPGRRHFRSRVISVGLLGLAAAISNDFADSLWSYHPWSWSLAKAGYDLLSWTAAGLILSLDRFRPSVDKRQKQEAPSTG